MSPEELLNQERARQEINWTFIGEAVQFYKDKDYKYIEVPWLVSDDSVRMTWDGPITHSTPVGHLVGSAEQSILDLEIHDSVPKGNLVTCSPCWRDEVEYDDWHQTSFIKVELYSKECNWMKFADDALKLFNKHFPHHRLQLVKCPDGPYETQYDIFLNLKNGLQVELGSYGYRIAKGIKWSYGTGLAEPRTSQALKWHRSAL